MIIKPNKNSTLGILLTIKYSLRGLYISLKNDQSFRTTLILQMFILLIVLSVRKKIKPINIFLSLMSIIIELINSSIEQTLDIAHPSYSPLVRDAKDTGSSFSFLYFIISVYLQFKL